MGGVTLATNASPTEAQIQTEMTILAAKAGASTATATDTQNLSDFTSHVNAFHAAAGATNPLLTALGDSTHGALGEVATATDNLTTFNAAVAALTTANADVAALAGYQAAVDAANGLFTANDYTLVDIDSQPVAGVAIGSAASDVFVAGSANASISLFNLQGADSLFIGTEYTLNTGKLSAGSDTTLEAFVGTDTSGNATITLEKHAYSSHVAAVAGDTIVITLVGVDASTIHLDSNGIITAGPHA
jgi:hypothetical protein